MVGASIWIVEAIAELDILPPPVRISLYLAISSAIVVWCTTSTLLCYVFRIFSGEVCIITVRTYSVAAVFHSPRPMTSRNKGRGRRADQGCSPIGRGEQARGLADGSDVRSHPRGRSPNLARNRKDLLLRRGWGEKKSPRQSVRLGNREMALGFQGGRGVRSGRTNELFRIRIGEERRPSPSNLWGCSPNIYTANVVC